MESQKLLERIEIFKGLTQDELGAIARLCEDRRYQANETIFDENSRGSEIYVIKKGKVRIDLGLTGKTDAATVHRVSDGDIFGELALVDTRRRSATAKCEKDSEIIAISRDGLLDLFDKNNHIGYVVIRNLATVLAARLRKTNLQLVASILWK